MRFVIRSLALGLMLLALVAQAGFAQGIRQTTGVISFLRIHDVGTGYGGPGNQLDGDVVIRFARDDNAYGFRLRDDANAFTHQGMLHLLLAAYEHEWPVTIDYRFEEGKTNFVLFRVWVTRR